MSDRKAATGPKVLFLSEILGTPSHQHPWRDYSVAFLECLKEAGAEVTLVVERAFGFDAGGGPGAVNEETRLTSVYGYLTSGEHNPRLFYRGLAGRLLALHAPALLRSFARRQDRRTSMSERAIPNRPRDTTRLPDRVAYLQNVDRFLFLRRFYSSADLRAVYDTGPVEIDGAGYDVVIVDGLIPVRVTGTTSERIVTVVHDLTGISAPDTRVKRRLIAGQALVCMAQHRGVALFASEHARERLDALAAGVPRHDSIVLGPIVSKRVRALSRVSSENRTSAYLAGVELKSRKAAFLQAVGPAGILEQLVRSSLSTSDAPSSPPPRGSLTEKLPTVALMWPGGSANELRPLVKLAQELSGLARIVVIGAKVPEPMVPKPGLPVPKPIEIPVNLHLAGNLPEPDRLGLMQNAALVIYPERTGAGSKLLEAVALDAAVLCFDTPTNRAMLGSTPATFVPREAGNLAPFVLAYLTETGGKSTNRVRAESGSAGLSSASAAETVRVLLNPHRSLVGRKVASDA